uniref:Uncharacterized protein n=1 Tax=Anguilla anguilla TaxID=7936 RepID=A0A0E9R0J6_ANGAN
MSKNNREPINQSDRLGMVSCTLRVMTIRPNVFLYYFVPIRKKTIRNPQLI